MGGKVLERELRKARRSAFRGRSSLYRYIREHFKELTAAGFGSDDGPSWQTLTETLTRAGQVNAREQPLKRSAVIAVFKRVQRDVAKERSYQLTGVKAVRHQPSRAPATWQPPVSQPQPPTRTSEPAPARGGLPAQTADPGDPPPGSWEYVRRELAKMSGR